MSTIRLLTSELTVAKSTSAGSSKKSTISNLAVVIPTKALIHPYGLAYEVTSGGTSAIGDCMVTEMLFRSVDNKENVYSLLKGATKISLGMALDLVKPDAAGAPLTERGYDPDMGLELEIICENTNSTDDLVVAIGWKVGNAHSFEHQGPSGNINDWVSATRGFAHGPGGQTIGPIDTKDFPSR